MIFTNYELYPTTTMNSAFIPFIPAGMTINDLKNALETHYRIAVIGIDMVQTPRGYMFFAHFKEDLREADVADIDTTTQYKLMTGTGQFFFVRRNTGKLDVSDPGVYQILFYRGKTYMCTYEQVFYTLISNEWVKECPSEIIGIYIHRQPLQPLSKDYVDAKYGHLTYAELVV